MLIKVMYQNNKFDMVKPSILDELVASGKLKKFSRSGGWVTIGIDPIRGMGGSYEGSERRKTSNKPMQAKSQNVVSLWS